jgi:hypothetical protein
MDDEQLIKDAAAAIGSGEQEDYKIRPSEHAASLGAPATALSKILRGSRLRSAANRYEERDLAATKAQTVFKKTAKRANLAVFLTSCLSAATLVVGAFVHDSNWLLITLGSCGVFSGALGATWLFEIRQGNLLEAWLTERARAEAERLKYFELAALSRENCEPGGHPIAVAAT